MTGVTSTPWRDSLEFYWSDVCYLKVKDSAEKFAVLQFGVCPFRWDSSKRSFNCSSVIKKHFQDLSYVQINGEDPRQQQLVVHTDSKDERELLMKEVKDEHLRQAEMKVQAAVGFRHVIDLLSSEKKLIAGHNCFLDIYSKFVGPLPSTAEELSLLLTSVFHTSLTPMYS